MEQDSLLLKQSAKLVTDAILSNGTEGLDMTATVRSWRSLGHLAEVVVALELTRSQIRHARMSQQPRDYAGITPCEDPARIKSRQTIVSAER